MALRQVTKRDSHFLVKYFCDNKLQVRGSGFFGTSEKISVGKTYLVQWGHSKRDAAEAEVLASGTEAEMKDRLRTTEEERTRGKAGAGKKRKRNEKTAKGDTAKKASVIRLVEPGECATSSATAPDAEPDSVPLATRDEVAGNDPGPAVINTCASSSNTTVPVPSSPGTPRSQPRPALEVAASEPRMVPTTPTLPRPSSMGYSIPPPQTASPTTAVLQSSPVPAGPAMGSLRISRPNSDNSRLVTSLAAIELTMRTMSKELEKLRQQGEARGRQISELKDQVRSLDQKMDKMKTNCTCGGSSESRDSAVEPMHLATESDPQDLSLDPSIVDALQKSSFNAGHFACKLTQRLFPELFGVDNLRLKFNWNGGGTKDKKELDPQRKALIRSYVTRYYPEVRADTAWRDSVINKVNECLRRRVRIEKRQTQPAQEQTPRASESFINFVDYMNSTEEYSYYNM